MDEIREMAVIYGKLGESEKVGMKKEGAPRRW